MEEIKPVEIKDLNKTQLIWLAILLSFVISIATGIVTVTLMQQAPPAVTQTINRVVQQTIEKVAPDYSATKTQTIIVKEDDLVVDAVSKTRDNIGTLFASKDATDSLTDAYSVGGGTFIVGGAPLDSTKTYSILLPANSADTKTRFDVKVTGVSPLGISVVSVDDPVAKKLSKIQFGKDSDSKVGQTVVFVSSTDIGKGILQTSTNKKDDPSVNYFMLSPEPSTIFIGAIAVNLDGTFIGMVLPKGDTKTQIVGADAISKFIGNPTFPPAPDVVPLVPAVTPPPTTPNF